MQLSRWVSSDGSPRGHAEAGKDYVIDDCVLRDLDDWIAFPDVDPLSAKFRHEWVLRRAFRPYVHEPDKTPCQTGLRP